MKDGKLPPDANSSIRFSYGYVKGYVPRDGVYYKPFTTLEGIIEKETGKDPFIVEKKLKSLYKTHDFGRYEDPKLKDVPVCYLDTTVSTGGSSGSPALNAKGELVGIHFDSTYESVISDYYIIPSIRRGIKVDFRYVAFITDKMAGADYILKEMGL
jgi:hypothetical protein